MFSKKLLLLEEALKKDLLPKLETIPCPYKASSLNSGVIRIVFPEFTCLCPKTGYPDFAAIALYYLPDALCVELKSWKLYLNSFRMIGTFHETVTAHLFSTIKNVLKPRWVLIAGDFLPRGNVDTTIIFETDTPRPRGADLLISEFRPLCRGLYKDGK